LLRDTSFRIAAYSARVGSLRAHLPSRDPQTSLHVMLETQNGFRGWPFFHTQHRRGFGSCHSASIPKNVLKVHALGLTDTRLMKTSV